jgi:hypothetical protein
MISKNKETKDLARSYNKMNIRSDQADRDAAKSAK